MRWIYPPLPRNEVLELGGRIGVGPILAELLLRAGHGTPESAQRFLQPALAGLQDPFLLKNLDLAVARLRRAIERRENVVVLGDYDVDGVSSTAFLVSVLRRFGVSPRFVVPRRLEEGYGLSRATIDRALEQGTPHLFIALDCGTNSHVEVDYLRGQGVDVLIIDHHRSKEAPLAQGILVNPHLDEVPGDAAWRNLCTVGLVFKLVHGLLKQLRAENHPVAQQLRLRDYLDLVALGTVADLVPLVGENRILAHHGLVMLQRTSRRGLRTLMQVSGMKPAQEVHPVDISFRMGPRINASGRLADAALSVELILSDDEHFCQEAARRLDSFNRERQELEREISVTAERIIEESFSDCPGIVLYHDDWHPGVVGIVASRVTRKYHRPCIVLGNEGDLAKGSGRSVKGINLVEVLGLCREHLASWGGHPMAVGVSLHKQHLESFRESFAVAIRAQPGGALSEPQIEISCWLQPGQVDELLMDELETLHPFGQGNPRPVFGLCGAVLCQPPEVFKEQHFRFQLEHGGGRRLPGVAWKLAHRLPPHGEPLDLAVELAWNHFNGRKLLQLELVDWRENQR